MTGVVEVDCLTRRFGSRRGVTDVTFGIDAGEVFGFLGPNGAGKSTTIRLLLGLYRATSGRIRVFGLDPVRDAVAVHARAGYLAGDLALHPRLTGRQHLDRLGHARVLDDTAYRDELVERFGARRRPGTFHRAGRSSAGERSGRAGDPRLSEAGHHPGGCIASPVASSTERRESAISVTRHRAQFPGRS